LAASRQVRIRATGRPDAGSRKHAAAYSWRSPFGLGTQCRYWPSADLLEVEVAGGMVQLCDGSAAAAATAVVVWTCFAYIDSRQFPGSLLANWCCAVARARAQVDPISIYIICELLLLS